MKFNVQELLNVFRKFRKTLWFRVLYLVVLGIIVAELFPFIYSNQAAACLGLLLMPAAVFVVPYYFGERSVKNFALNGIPVLIIAILLATAFQTQATTSPAAFDLTSGFPPDATDLPRLTLWNGTVTPASATPPADFNFTVRLKTVPANLTNVTVYLNLTALEGLAGPPRNYTMPRDPARVNDTSNGTWFSLRKHLDPGIYEFSFWANDTRGNFTYTFSVLGPITAGFFNYYALWGQFFALNMVIPFSFYYVIVFMFWYTARMRKTRSRMVDAKAKAGKDEDEEEKPKPKSAPRGKASKVTAFTCTNCGADVEETDEKCPKCGAVFED